MTTPRLACDKDSEAYCSCRLRRKQLLILQSFNLQRSQPPLLYVLTRSLCEYIVRCSTQHYLEDAQLRERWASGRAIGKSTHKHNMNHHGECQLCIPKQSICMFMIRKIVSHVVGLCEAMPMTEHPDSSDYPACLYYLTFGPCLPRNFFVRMLLELKGEHLHINALGRASSFAAPQTGATDKRHCKEHATRSQYVVLSYLRNELTKAKYSSPRSPSSHSNWTC